MMGRIITILKSNIYPFFCVDVFSQYIYPLLLQFLCLKEYLNGLFHLYFTKSFTFSNINQHYKLPTNTYHIHIYIYKNKIS